MSCAASWDFKGVITTDDIGMGAVSALFEKPGAAAARSNAGCDLIMMSAHWTDTNRVMSLAQNLLESLNRGELDSGTFEASQQRIERLLSRRRCIPSMLYRSKFWSAMARYKPKSRLFARHKLILSF